MGDYQLYYLREDGRIRRRADWVCLDDEDAMRLAQGLPNEHGLELWCGKRKVGNLPTRRPDQAASSPANRPPPGRRPG